MTRKAGTLTLKRPPGAAQLALSRRTPEDARKLRLAASRKVIGELRAKYPATFDLRRPKPLALGIGSEIAKARFGSWSACKLALHWWTRRPEYLAALAAPDAQRHTLDGTPAGPVSDDHRALAAERLATRQPKAHAAR